MTKAPEKEISTGQNLEDLKKILEDIANGKIPETISAQTPCHNEVLGIVRLLTQIQDYVAQISKGKLNNTLPFKGPIAGNLKSLQANLKHLSWQTKMVAEGDFDQRIEFMGEFSESFNMMVERLKYAKEQIEAKNIQLEKDLALAEEAQQNTMQFIRNVPYLDSELIFKPHSRVSGDFYDEFLDDEGALNLFMGDATGHGTSAALITMMAKMGLNTLPRIYSTDEKLSLLNSQLANCIPSEMFITGLFLKITSKGELFTANAGHPPLVILPEDRSEVVIVKGTGLALGMFEEEIEEYTEFTYQLKKGDRLVLFTDGLTECENNGKQLGVTGIVDFFEARRDKTLALIMAELMDTLYCYTEETGFLDDLTVISLEYKWE